MKKIQSYSMTIAGMIMAWLALFVACEKGPNFREFHYPAPVVGDFYPKEGYIGSDITIEGSDFGNVVNAVKVYFGGVLADTVRSVEDNQIVVQAPANGMTGILTVEIFGKQDVTEGVFTYMPSARIVAVSNDMALKDDEVTITGENFGTDPSLVQVFIGAGEAQVVSVSPTEVRFTVPDVSSGTVVLIVDGQRLTGPYLLVGVEKLTGTLIGHEGSWSNNPATMITAAVDGDITTFVDGASATGYVGYDLGAGKAAVLKSVRYVPRASHPARMVGGEIRGANDPSLSDYVVLHTITETPAAAVYTEADISTEEAYRYVYYYSPNGYCNIAEIEFYGSIIDKL